MHSSNPDTVWFVLSVFVIIVIAVIIYSSIQQKKRTAALTALAPILGFNFEGEDWTNPTRAPRLETALFDRGHGKRFKNIMSGSVAGLPTSIFDYWYTTGGGKSSHTWSQTVVAFSIDIWLPLFELRPESFMDRIGEVFMHTDIDFPSNPEFSHRYLLRGPEEEKIRELFAPALLAFLEQMPAAKKWHVEAEGSTLLLYCSDVLVDPDAIRDLLDETSSIAKTFLSCCGLKNQAKQL
jgi:hypothetical protein